jgi:hypothetical protein
MNRFKNKFFLGGAGPIRWKALARTLPGLGKYFFTEIAVGQCPQHTLNSFNTGLEQTT